MITKEHLNYILQETVKNPVPLTQQVLTANGLTPEWVEPDWEVWTYQQKFNITISLITDEEFGYAYRFKSESGEEVEIEYEHQLQGLISAYN